MGHIESNLIPGEQVLYKTGLHWTVLVGAMLAGGFFGLLGIVIVFAGVFGGGGIAVLSGSFILSIGVGCALLGHFQRKATELRRDESSCFDQDRASLSRKTFEMLNSKIESIGVEESLFGRMLGYGTVVVRGTGWNTRAIPQGRSPTGVPASGSTADRAS